MSMKTPDAVPSSDITRWDKAVEISELVRSDGTAVEIRKLAFGELVKPLNGVSKQPNENNVWPQGHRSDLAVALRQTLQSGSPLGHAVLMISDGAHNVSATESVLQAAREANAMATPVYTMTLGTSIGMKNMSIVAKANRMIAFPKNPLTLRVLLGHNSLAGNTTKVQLYKEDVVIQSQSIRLHSDPNHEIKFTIEEGATEPIERYRIVASEIEGEVTSADNQTTILVQRLDSPIGVLILEGKPYWDSKFLARNLAVDPVVELTTIVKLGAGRYLQKKVIREESKDKPGLSDIVETVRNDWSIEKELASPLESAELLDKYRLIILGREANAFLTDSAVETLRNWVSKSGGCVLCSRGAPAEQVPSKFAELLPVKWVPANEARVRAEVTQTGIDNSVFDSLLADSANPISTLPTLAIGATPKQRKGLPQVLMQSTTADSNEPIPVVTYQPFGNGQSIVVEGAGMWRWAFLAPQHASKERIYANLWQSMIQWIISQQDMLPGQEVALRPDRASFLTGEAASCSVILKNPTKWNVEADHGLSVLMQSSETEVPIRFSLTASGIDNGLFRADLGAPDVGYYTLKLVQGDQDQVLAASAFEVRDPWFENLEVDARPDLMSQIARISGGEVLQPEQAKQLTTKFEQAIKKQQKHEETRTTLWDRPIVMIMILAGWIATWVVRRQNGMI